MNRSSGSGRTTVRRESTLNQLIDGNVHPAVMGPREKLVPNKRGILKCQMWKVAVLRPRPTEPNLTKTKKFKIQYPMATVSIFIISKVGCVFPMVISPEFHMGQHRDDNHREDAPHFFWP